MKKILKTINLLLLMLILPLNVLGLSTTDSIEQIDITKENNLTINYNYNDYNFDNTKVNVYSVASISSDYQYELSNSFSKYPLKINGLKIDDWQIFEDTLISYISADNIDEDYSLEIKNNSIKLTNLKSGLYFVETEKIDNETYTLEFDKFLINLPNLSEVGKWEYGVVANPKIIEHTKNYENITYTVTKLWEDNLDNRPNEISIEIYKDNILFEEQILSSKNNWQYEWTTLDDGSTWNVVERNIPEYYTVSIYKNNNIFKIINTHDDYEEIIPKTYDDIMIYVYLFGTSFLIIIILLIYLFKKKNNR